MNSVAVRAGIDKYVAPLPFTTKEKMTILLAKQYFWFFLEHVFTKSLEGETFLHDDGTQRPFAFGDIHREWAYLAQFNPRLCLLAPRAHLKSTVLGQAFSMWHMFRVADGRVADIMYFSYKSTLAVEQVEQVLRLIRTNPYCRFWRDLRPQGRTVVNYLVDFGDGAEGEAIMRGEGILGATRGRHPNVVICDDILSDFSNQLSSPELEKINRVFRQSIMSLPANEDDHLVLIGTPQSYEDILYQLSNAADFMWVAYPAIKDEVSGEVQWPEKFTFERLRRIQSMIGRSAFEVEYQLTPSRVVNQFFSRLEVMNVIDPELAPWQLGDVFARNDLAVYAGFDVGRRVHPSHVSVFLELPSGTLVQIYQEFMDRLSYPKQVSLLNQVAETFSLSRGYFDATYNALEDRGLHPAWTGRQFTRKLKADMAVLLERRVLAAPSEPGIILLPDPRQLNQMTIVDRELKAATTAEGHGDAFWSNGLAVKAASDGPGVIDIGGVMPTGSRRRNSWISQLSSVSQ